MKRRCGPLYILKPLCLGASRCSTFAIICHVCFDTRGWRLPDQQLDSGEGKNTIWPLEQHILFLYIFFLYICVHWCTNVRDHAGWQNILKHILSQEGLNMWICFFVFIFWKLPQKQLQTEGHLSQTWYLWPFITTYKCLEDTVASLSWKGNVGTSSLEKQTNKKTKPKKKNIH